MQFPQHVTVTDQPIDLSKLSDTQREYYLNLADNIKDRYVSSGKGRQIFTVSGPAGAGKSVAVAIFDAIFQADDSINFVNVGLDAFHYQNYQLQALDLLDRKGRYDTYDVDVLRIKLKAFRSGDEVFFPAYSRIKHNPIPDQIHITEKDSCLFLEGQWFLRDAPQWEEIRRLSSCNYLVSGSVEDMKDGVVKRHMAGGRDERDAERFYQFSDLSNTKEVLKSRVQPDAEILFYKDI